MRPTLTTRSSFELAFLRSERSFWLFWPALTLLLWFSIEVASIVADEAIHPGTRVFVLGFVWMPVAIVGMARYFEQVMTTVSPLFWDDTPTFEQWLISRSRALLTLEPWPAKAVTGAILVCATVTLVVLGPPYQSLSLSVLVQLTILLVAWIYSQSAYMVLGLLVTLHDLSRRDLRLAFFFPPGRQLAPLLHFYTALTLILGLYHLTLVAALWFGPYPIEATVMVWIAVLAFFPPGVLVISSWLIHTMIARAKYANVGIINANVQKALAAATEDNHPETVQRLEALMGVQEKVHGVREWPVEFGGAITFTVTVSAALAQVVLAIAETMS